MCPVGVGAVDDSRVDLFLDPLEWETTQATRGNREKMFFLTKTCLQRRGRTKADKHLNRLTDYPTKKCIRRDFPIQLPPTPRRIARHNTRFWSPKKIILTRFSQFF